MCAGGREGRGLEITERNELMQDRWAHRTSWRTRGKRRVTDGMMAKGPMGRGSWTGCRKGGPHQQNPCSEVHVHVHHFAKQMLTQTMCVYHTAPYWEV